MARQQVKLAELPTAERGDLSQRLDLAGWAILLIWVGVAILADIGWGWGVVGIGLITVGEQAVRWYAKLKFEVFWVVCGSVFLGSGLWELLNVRYPLVSILLILGGLAVLWGSLKDIRTVKK